MARLGRLERRTALVDPADRGGRGRAGRRRAAQLERIVTNLRVRTNMVAWYIANVALLFGFCLVDRAGLAIYPAAALVVVVAAGVVLPPRTVLQVGILATLGYVGRPPSSTRSAACSPCR